LAPAAIRISMVGILGGRASVLSVALSFLGAMIHQAGDKESFPYLNKF
jgi:hypothetical protein